MNLTNDLLDKMGRAYVRSMLDGGSGVEAMKAILNKPLSVQAIDINGRHIPVNTATNLSEIQNEIWKLEKSLREARAAQS